MTAGLFGHSRSFYSTLLLDRTATTQTRWHITGDFLENCNCTVVCPCTFSPTGPLTSKPTQGACEWAWGFHITSGSYSDVPVLATSYIRSRKITKKRKMERPKPSFFERMIQVANTGARFPAARREHLTVALRLSCQSARICSTSISLPALSTTSPHFVVGARGYQKCRQND